ncbi:MAG: DUF2911 domain-containing protein [Bacteroidota bacterium]
MKKLFFLVLFAGLIFTADAQSFSKMDGSPMDAVYFPGRRDGAPKLRVLYSRPQKKDRDIFGGLLAYGDMWRVGANEATEILFLTDAKINGTSVKAGRYTIYAIPNESEWEVFFSSDVDKWGHYQFDPSASTVAKITVPTAKTPSTVEAMSIVFEAVDNGAHMIIGWDDTMVRVPIEI